MFTLVRIRSHAIRWMQTFSLDLFSLPFLLVILRQRLPICVWACVRINSSSKCMDGDLMHARPTLTRRTAPRKSYSCGSLDSSSLRRSSLLVKTKEHPPFLIKVGFLDLLHRLSSYLSMDCTQILDNITDVAPALCSCQHTFSGYSLFPVRPHLRLHRQPFLRLINKKRRGLLR